MNADYLNSTPVKFCSSHIPATNDELKQILYSYGAVMVAVSTTQLNLDGYTKGIISIDKGGYDPDHVLVLVGYGKSFWILRNSWGVDWGISGHVAIAFTDAPNDMFSNYFFVANYQELALNFDVYSRYANQAVNIPVLPLEDEKAWQTPQNLAVVTPRPTYKKRATGLILPLLPPRDFATPVPLSDIPSEFQETMSYTSQNNRFRRYFNGIVLDQGSCGDCWLVAGCALLSIAFSMVFVADPRAKNPTNYFVNISPTFFKLVVSTLPQPIFVGQRQTSSGCFSMDWSNNVCYGGYSGLFEALVNGYITNPPCEVADKQPIGTVSLVQVPFEKQNLSPLPSRPTFQVKVPTDFKPIQFSTTDVPVLPKVSPKKKSDNTLILIVFLGLCLGIFVCIIAFLVRRLYKK